MGEQQFDARLEPFVNSRSRGWPRLLSTAACRAGTSSRLRSAVLGCQQRSPAGGVGSIDISLGPGEQGADYILEPSSAGSCERSHSVACRYLGIDLQVS